MLVIMTYATLGSFTLGRIDTLYHTGMNPVEAPATAFN